MLSITVFLLWPCMNNVKLLLQYGEFNLDLTDRCVLHGQRSHGGIKMNITAAPEAALSLHQKVNQNV